METRYSKAAWRPLGTPTDEPSIGTPRVFIIHTMSGYLMGTDAYFRANGYGGTESHFGIGGNYDRPDLDGAVIQWQLLDRQADAQFAGNAYATSVETSDGAKINVRWSAKQMEAIIQLGVWWCKQTGNPAVLVKSPNGKGFGYHSQFPSWNQNAHACPGSVRLIQYKNEVIPEIARRLEGNEDMASKEEIFDAVWKQDRLPALDGDPSGKNPNWFPGNALKEIWQDGKEDLSEVKALRKEVAELAKAVAALKPVEPPV
jgi:hypothetical protein